MPGSKRNNAHPPVAAP